MSGWSNPNVEKCVGYLRSAGIEISADTEREWALREAETRARRRAHNRELKRSCGHFRTYVCTTVSDEGTFEDHVCFDCHRSLASKRRTGHAPRRGA